MEAGWARPASSGWLPRSASRPRGGTCGTLWKAPLPALLLADLFSSASACTSLDRPRRPAPRRGWSCTPSLASVAGQSCSPAQPLLCAHPWLIRVLPHAGSESHPIKRPWPSASPWLPFPQPLMPAAAGRRAPLSSPCGPLSLLWFWGLTGWASRVLPCPQLQAAPRAP